MFKQRRQFGLKRCHIHLPSALKVQLQIRDLEFQIAQLGSERELSLHSDSEVCSDLDIHSRSFILLPEGVAHTDGACHAHSAQVDLGDFELGRFPRLQHKRNLSLFAKCLL